ncbi:hypothetical protein M9Y10_011618 [Tritrichomonas musculus]|uniref:E3 ubiquitin ligase UBR4 C-terminal domain-containing protein n=1 Tax=Tritrichomonas musculus TaxID=1915356 RepID=A0ABR2IKN1_9EUKA
MDRFLNLQLDPSSSVPPIGKLIATVGDDTNLSFFKAGNFLHSGQTLNPIYTFVAIRDLISLSPLSINDPGNDQEKVEEYTKSLLPSSSFKWLYLLYSISSRKLSDDKELETAKNEYVFLQLHDFVVNANYDIPGVAQFVVGILCLAARLTDFIQTTFPSFTTPAFFDTIYKLLNRNQYPSPVIALTEFSAPELFSFLSPLALEYLPPANLFQDIAAMVHTAILRLLYRIFAFVLPENIEAFKTIIQPLCVNGLTIDVARSVLTQLFNGDENAASCYSDMIQYKLLTCDIARHSKETDRFKRSLNYQSSIQLSTSLHEIIKIAEGHPERWGSFLDQNPSTVADIVDIMSSESDSDFIIASAVLLRLGKAQFDNLELALNLFISSGSQKLRAELSQLLLLQPEKIVPLICKSFPVVCRFGSRSSIYFNFLSDLISKIEDPKPILQSLMESLKSEFVSIQLHPNSHIYTQLANYINVQGSYLDSQPCSVCNNPERPPTRKRLNEIQSESKYQHDAIYTKLKNPLLISAFSLSFNVKKRSRTPRTVRIYISSAELNQANDLLTTVPHWLHVSDLHFARDATSASVTLPLQLFATCLKFHFTEFWEDPSNSLVLRCPQCHNEIPDRRSGICPRCHENAYHCRECRGINYNHLDGFICKECGSSSYVSMDWTVTAVQSFSHTLVHSSEDVETSLTKCDELMGEAAKIFASLGVLRNSIEQTLSPTTNISVDERISKLKKYYNEECKSCIVKLTDIVQHVSAIRLSIALYLDLIDGQHQCSVSNMCYNCRATYIRKGLAFLAKAAETKAIESLNAPSLLISFIDSTTFTADAVGSLLMFCKIRPDLTNRVVELFKESLPNPSPHMVRLLCEIGTIDDKYKKQRFQAIAHATVISTEFINANGSMTPTVIQPLVASVLSSSLIIRKPQIQTELEVFQAWRKMTVKNDTENQEEVEKEVNLINPLDVMPLDTLKVLLVDCTSQSVRETIANLLKDSAKISQSQFSKVSKFILNILSSVESFSLNYEQAIDVLNFLLLDQVHQREALTSDLFDELVNLLEKESEKIFKLEHTLVLDLSVGCIVYMLTKLLTVFFNDNLNSRYILLRKREIIIRIIHIFFRIRCLIIQRSKFINDTLSLIKMQIISLLFKDIVIDEEDNIVFQNKEEGSSMFIRAAADSIKYGHQSVIRELSTILVPKPVVMNIPIITKKSRGQEDFMPGQMPKEPFMSRNVGTIMRQVKNKICTDLGMESLIEDDHGMELLVDNKIISLDLPIEDVYKKVWVPAKGETPMLVICRLQGLDGEATEPIINSFAREGTENVDKPEVKFAYTTVLCENDGFKPFLDALKSDMTPFFVTDAVVVLNCFVAVKENRVVLGKMGFIEVLFDIMEKIVAERKVRVKLLENLIHLCDSLIRENPSADSNPCNHIDFVFKCLNSPVIQENESLLSPILALIPPLASTSRESMQKVPHFFLNGLLPTKEDKNPDQKQEESSENKKEFNIYETPNSLQLLNGFGEFLLTIPADEPGNAIRDVIFQQPFLSDAVSYLEKLFPLSEGRNSDRWKQNVEVKSLPSLLKTLAGMVSSHESTQKLLLNKSLIQLLLELSTMTSSMSIGELASMVIEKACQEPSICSSAIKAEIDNRSKQAKEKALAEKKRVLEENKKSISSDYIKMIEELEDEENDWECCICKEGYAYLPNDQLGFYVFESKTALCSVTSTHFVCVHMKCHYRERSSDRSFSDRDRDRDRDRFPTRGHSKNSLSEWEAAAVRNCERPCNAIFPVPSDTLTLAAYRQSLIKFYENVSKSPDFTMNIVYDLKFHLNKLGEGSVIELSKGGGSMPNSVAIFPFLVYAGTFFMDSLDGPLTITSYEQSIAQQETTTTTAAATATTTATDSSFGIQSQKYTQRTVLEKRIEKMINGLEDPADSLALSLWILSLDDWIDVKLKLLKLFIKKLNNKSADDQSLFNAAKPIFIKFVIIDRMQKMMKKLTGIKSTLNESGFKLKSHRGEPWILDFLCKVASGGFALCNEWKDFGEEVEDEIIKMTDLRSAFLYLQIENELSQFASPFEWIRAQQ